MQACIAWRATDACRAQLWVFVPHIWALEACPEDGEEIACIFGQAESTVGHA